MEDVEMRWRVGRKSIVGADNVNLPQFSLVKYNTLSTIQVLASGKHLCYCVFTWKSLSIQPLMGQCATAAF